jgi:hypothetical protein
MVHVEVGTSLDQVERLIIEATLEAYKSKPKAAEVLGISLKTLYNRIHRYMKEPTAKPDAPDSELEIVERIVDRSRREALERRTK